MFQTCSMLNYTVSVAIRSISIEALWCEKVSLFYGRTFLMYVSYRSFKTTHERMINQTLMERVFFGGLYYSCIYKSMAYAKMIIYLTAAYTCLFSQYSYTVNFFLKKTFKRCLSEFRRCKLVGCSVKKW